MSRVYRKTVCGRCPKWQLGGCVRLGKQMCPAHPACAIGRKLINSRQTSRRAKSRAKKASTLLHFYTAKNYTANQRKEQP